MKVPLKTFFAGVGVGILLAFLGVGFLSDARPGSRTATTGVWEISASTNQPVQYKRVVQQRD